MMTRIKRIAIIGLSGSGSTFAAKMRGILKLPVYHLDKVLFNEEGKKRDPDEFQLSELLAPKGTRFQY